MATRIHREIHNIEQRQKVIPFFSWSECQRVGFWCQNIWFGFFGSKLILSSNQSIKSNSVGPGHMSHRWTSAFDDHFNHSFVIIKDVQLRFIVRRMCVGGHIIHIAQLIKLLSFFTFWTLVVEWRVAPVPWMLVRLGWTLLLVERNTSITMSQRSRASNPSYAFQHPEKWFQTL